MRALGAAEKRRRKEEGREGDPRGEAPEGWKRRDQEREGERAVKERGGPSAAPPRPRGFRKRLALP